MYDSRSTSGTSTQGAIWLQCYLVHFILWNKVMDWKFSELVKIWDIAREGGEAENRIKILVEILNAIA